jgi:hypothetical protein
MAPAPARQGGPVPLSSLSAGATPLSALPRRFTPEHSHGPQLLGDSGSSNRSCDPSRSWQGGSLQGGPTPQSAVRPGDRPKTESALPPRLTPAYFNSQPRTESAMLLPQQTPEFSVPGRSPTSAVDSAARELLLEPISLQQQSYGRYPVAGEWTDSVQTAELLRERQEQRASQLEWKQQLWRKWKQRSAFDQWRRRFRVTNRAVFARLHRVSTFEKGKTARCRHAFERWLCVVEQLRKREMKKLQAVAELRLNMLMSGMAETADPLKHTRRLAVRWSQPLVHKTFHAWKGWCVPVPVEPAAFHFSHPSLFVFASPA